MKTPKSWGYEDEVYNGEYCAKRMFVKVAHQSSVHRHHKKDEVLMLASGLVYFELGENVEDLKGMFMRPFDRIRVKPGQWHRFSALESSSIFEASTHHDDSDSERHIPGGRMDANEFLAILTLCSAK